MKRKRNSKWWEKSTYYRIERNQGILLPGEVQSSLRVIKNYIEWRQSNYSSSSQTKFLLNKYKIHYVNDFSVGIIILRTDDTCKFRSNERYYLSS